MDCGVPPHGPPSKTLRLRLDSEDDFMHSGLAGIHSSLKNWPGPWSPPRQLGADDFMSQSTKVTTQTSGLTHATKMEEAHPLASCQTCIAFTSFTFVIVIHNGQVASPKPQTSKAYPALLLLLLLLSLLGQLVDSGLVGFGSVSSGSMGSGSVDFGIVGLGLGHNRSRGVVRAETQDIRRKHANLSLILLVLGIFPGRDQLCKPRRALE